MGSLIEQLQQLGFNQYEAQAYLALLEKSPANGYDLAKRSGVPRPNIYPVLRKLEERGAILRVETPDGVQYTPLAPQDLLSRLNQQYQESLAAAREGLGNLAAAPTLEYTLNLRSYPLLLDHARSLIDAAQQHLLLIFWPQESEPLAQTLQRARDRSVRMLTLCMNACPQPCGYCQGEVFRYPIARPENARWLVLVRDSDEMLAGEIPASGSALAVRTRQTMLVKLAEGYIQHSLALAKILADLGGRFGDLLDPQTLVELDILQSQSRWLDAMRQGLRGEADPPGGRK